MKVRPFLKWAGGKRRQLGEILPRLPRRIDTYYEPCIGGGAVFLALAAEPRSERRYLRVVLGDINAEVVNVWQVVRDHLGPLIEALRYAAAYATDPTYFGWARALTPASLTPIERAARLIFLNRTAHAGLWRENRRGQFNVSFGRYVNPTICDADNLAAVSLALQGVEVVRADCVELVEHAGPGDAVYWDPPYVPIASGSFVGYSGGGFKARDHRRVARAFERCIERGAFALLSNSSAAASLYAACECVRVSAPRPINRHAAGRGPIDEILVIGRRSEARGAA
ncbi:DNA adenine methylase [Myxococcota bacterium]|nr:DNA adenine methylase [Myxococcota bacterium]